METIPFIKLALHELHRSLVREVKDLHPEQMNYRPAPEANSINFLTWHIARTEDAIFHRISPGTIPAQIWENEHWYERFGLDAEDSGTGFTAPQVGTFNPEIELLLSYCERVFETVMEELDHITQANLAEVLNPERPHITTAHMIKA